MAGELLLVGSIPLETVEEVFRTFAGPLGQWLAYMPDGEVGDRQYWIEAIAYRVLNGHPDIETIKRPAPDADGVERWQSRGLEDQFVFRLKPGVKQVRFGDPGWRLGYTRDAINSFFVFRKLKEEGVIPAPVRFQVCIPPTFSAVTAFFRDPADEARIVPGFTAALRAEVKKMVEKIPPANLAIQWDLAVENHYVEEALRTGGAAAAKAEAARVMEPLREIAPDIPEQVALGYHACFGTIEGWPTRQPRDLTGAVALLNAAVAASGRRVDFVHLPTLGTADDAFLAPLAELKVQDARVYLGAIHHLHDREGLRRQLTAARKYLTDFGIGAPCGFGRIPDRPSGFLPRELPSPDQYLDIILKDHIAAVEILHEVIGR